MNDTGKHIVIRLKKRWQLLVATETVLYALAAAFIVFAFRGSLLLAFGCFKVFSLLQLFLKKPWEISVDKISNFLDEKLTSMENSTGLFFIPEEQLSDLALLQRHKVQGRLKSEINQVQPKVSLKKAFLVFLVCTVGAFLLHYFNVFENMKSHNSNTSSEQTIIFQPSDSTTVKNTPPSITQQKLIIKYPAYTRLSSRTTTDMNVKALEGSQLFWSIQFDKDVDTVLMEKDSESYPLKQKKNEFSLGTKLIESSFYNFKFIDTDGASYLSELYALEVVKDEEPKIEIQELKQFNTFDLSDNKKLKFTTIISDDFGVSDAFIIATVSKGEGESVKFREERLPFNDFKNGGKKVSLNKTIDLDALKMEAGDELYFYIEALDVKLPKAQRTRSETYFAVIRDTISNQFAVEGTMGTDLMPDYFRSQRQLIIDTEKLIANRNKLSKKDFNSTSNELGYDQKALRLKYGEFMGDEEDSRIQVSQEIETIGEVEEDSQDDPLAKYTHDHDSANEHNLVDHDHKEEELSEEKDDPLHDYLHNHDDPEESTLFTQSLKSKLRQAMAEMWDAELHLRLYEPRNSLPYQYRALKLIQEIKNSARIYVHRIGFDPPPIKEDKRLTGEIYEVKTFQKSDEITLVDDFAKMRESVSRISELAVEKSVLTDTDRKLFATAGNELAALAIETPGKYLNTLQLLKWASERKQTSIKQLQALQSGLRLALPDMDINPNKGNIFEDEINTMMLKELESND